MDTGLIALLVRYLYNYIMDKPKKVLSLIFEYDYNWIKNGK